MANEWRSDPRGEIIGSEYVVPPGAGRGQIGPRFTPERVRPAPRVLSADEERVLRRNRDMFFGAELPGVRQIAAYRNPTDRNPADSWEWDRKHHRWVKG